MFTKEAIMEAKQKLIDNGLVVDKYILRITPFNDTKEMRKMIATEHPDVEIEIVPPAGQDGFCCTNCLYGKGQS